MRESNTAAGDFVLSVLYEGEVVHYQIRRHGEDAFFSIGKTLYRKDRENGEYAIQDPNCQFSCSINRHVRWVVCNNLINALIMEIQ